MGLHSCIRHSSVLKDLQAGTVKIDMVMRPATSSKWSQWGPRSTKEEGKINLLYSGQERQCLSWGLNGELEWLKGVAGWGGACSRQWQHVAGGILLQEWYAGNLMWCGDYKAGMEVLMDREGQMWLDRWWSLTSNAQVLTPRMLASSLFLQCQQHQNHLLIMIL